MEINPSKPLVASVSCSQFDFLFQEVPAMGCFSADPRGWTVLRRRFDNGESMLAEYFRITGGNWFLQISVSV